MIRLSEGGLFVWSPIALSQNLKAQVDALGQVEFIVAPNAVHHLFFGDWASAYPEALLFGPARLMRKRPEIAWDGTLEDAAVAGWAADINQVVVRRGQIDIETVFFHRASGTAVFADLIQHFERTWFKGWRAFAARLDLMTAPQAEVPRKFRLALGKGAAARTAVERILQWPIERVVMAHGEPVMRDGHAFIADRFRWLKVR
nr:hypothetical protein [Croceibacterium sp. D39]